MGDYLLLSTQSVLKGFEAKSLHPQIPPQEKASRKIPPEENPSRGKSLQRKIPPSKIPPHLNTSQQNTSRHNATQQNTYNLEKAYVQI